jgi:hypothetical protein
MAPKLSPGSTILTFESLRPSPIGSWFGPALRKIFELWQDAFARVHLTLFLKCE